MVSKTQIRNATTKNESLVSLSCINKIWNFSLEIGNPNEFRVEFKPSGVKKKTKILNTNMPIKLVVNIFKYESRTSKDLKSPDK